MLDACDRAGVKLMTAFPMRFSAPVREIKAQLDAGELGRVYCCNAHQPGRDARAPSRLVRGPRSWPGGGAVMDHTVHLADILRWYLDSEVVEVYAQTNQILHADEVAVETGGLLMLTFANGVFASIDCSWSKPDYYPTWGGLTFELVTERGAVLVDAFRQNLTVYSAGASAAPPGRTGARTPTRPCWRSLSRPSARTARRRVSRPGRLPRAGGRAGRLCLRAERPARAAHGRLRAPATPIMARNRPGSPPRDCGRSEQATRRPPAPHSRSARRARRRG